MQRGTPNLTDGLFSDTIVIHPKEKVVAMEIAHDVITLVQWGNSKALRLPAALANVLGYSVNDKLQLNVEVADDGSKRLVIEKIHSIPQSIEELFQGYDEGPFQAEVQEFEPLGNELW